MEQLEGRTAVVTGAAAGIGRALAERAADEGMNVVLADVEADTLREVAKGVEGRGAGSLAIVTDVSQPEALTHLADETYGAFGACHLLCNNAGVFAAGGPIWETPLADFDWQFAVNTLGIVHGLRAFIPRMLAAGTEGHVLNTASMAAVTTCPLSSGYYASKHAALSLSETLYHELTQRDASIGVSTLCPELVDTRIGDAERNRTPQWDRKEDDDEDHPERDLVDKAIRELVRTGAPPAVLAERAFGAIRENRFYVLSPPDRGWRRASEARLEDIRLERNPTFMPIMSND